MNSAELLQHYRRGSEAAFSELVHRFGGLVYGAARRRLNDAALIDEVAQTVFTRFARQAPEFAHEAQVVAWLHRTTVHVTLDLWRSERRRRQRETLAASTMESAAPPPETSRWEDVAPELDEALNHLSDPDRESLLLRFFQGRAMKEIGTLLGISEDAAKMRVSRALDRLRTSLTQRGVSCSAVALVGLLGTQDLNAASAETVGRLATSLETTVRTLPAPRTGHGLFVGHLAGIGWRSATIALVGSLLGWFLLTRGPLVDPPTEPQPVVPANAAVALTPRESFRRATPAASTRPSTETTPAWLTLEIVDAGDQSRIVSARVEAVFFFAGGESEGQEQITDSSGIATIRAPRRRDASSGANIFVTVGGYVPCVFSLPSTQEQARRTLRLERAATIGGQVVDDRGTPVPNAKVSLDIPQEKRPEDVRWAFHHDAAAIVTQANGAWLCPYVPSTLDTVPIQVSHPDYATTLTTLSTRGPAAAQATVVLKRGVRIHGRVVDAFGQPVPRARVREYHNFGYPRQSTTAGDDGSYILRGVGMTWAREGIITDEPKALLVIEAENLAPRKRVISLREPEIRLDVQLDPGAPLRGHVLDVAGRPIPETVIRTDADSEGQRPYVWSGRTDAAGRFVWPNAPRERVLYWFEAPGLPAQRGMLLEPGDEDIEIRLGSPTP